ncbi:(d)CMP kinase [Pelagibacterales bacterium SAG-MED39]|nr:(d)CMP kinase [Pelagibacterales bacterium SAG-MED39]
MKKSLIIACDGEAASGKSTGAKLVSKKYKLLLINSGLFYRYASNLVLKHKPKKVIPFLKKQLPKTSYKKISSQNLHSQEISQHVGYLAQNREIRLIINNLQKKMIKKNNRICLEGRDIASKVLKKNPKYDLAFYFKCDINTASYRRWKDLKKKVPLSDVKKSLQLRTKLDKNRAHSPLKRVKDSILIQTHKLNKSQMLNKMIKEIEKKII